MTLAPPLVLLSREYDGGMKEGPIKYVREFLGKVKGQFKMDEEKNYYPILSVHTSHYGLFGTYQEKRVLV